MAQKNKPVTFVQFGSGGGFTGLIVNYSIYKNGQIFKEEKLPNKPSEQRLYTRVSKKEVKKIFKKLTPLQLHTVTLKETGNVTNNLKIVSKNTPNSVVITWGIENTSIPSAVAKAYELLTKFIEAHPPTVIP